MPISCIIVDDEQPALEELNFLLSSMPDVRVIGQGRNGVEAIRLVEELEPDLLFLDIEMPGLNGFKVVEQLSKKDVLPQVIFVTAYDQYAVMAFDVNAMDYILKPIEKSRLEKAVQRVKKQLETYNKVSGQLQNLISLMASPEHKAKKSKLLVKDKNRNLLIDSEDLIYASVSESVVHVATQDLMGETNFRTLEELQANLDPEIFWRVHRSYLVNINKIKEVVPWFNRTLQLKMADRKETEIPVSRSHSKRLKEYLNL
ncbi:MAG TPA: LytTR family DNA-binding domain-containing protein [Candidatus Hodarchaeales archaeon]|nr:LytTR family DNA-binding domain-containing protein [Candidatus Hodarchaeales archaeon]